jgi:repressor LexA
MEAVMKELTSRQQQILDFVTRSIRERGYPPTIREIGRAFGIRSPNGVNDHLKALQRKGYLAREDLKSRALCPTGFLEQVALTGRTVEVPLIGKVAAGRPVLAVENIEDRVVVDRFFLGKSADMFALRVRGDSMIEDGIHDGDFLFVHKQAKAERGAVVVAMIEGEATVKRYYPEGDSVRFQPAHPTMKPIVVHRNEFKEAQILGVVVGIFRKM